MELSAATLIFPSLVSLPILSTLLSRNFGQASGGTTPGSICASG
uniref:Uncharacterized protein n=1 Tax=Setaria viridis TaxID=4556 RepID=A0A4U6U823_SETVI|nr:hypothetical protein SEVIR_6G112150v2 [Setaria viridis]